MIKKAAEYFHSHRAHFIEDTKLLLILGAAALFLGVIHVGCPIRFFTGISCPGCGMSRALLSLGMCHFDAAWHYHPLAFLIPPSLIAWYFRELIPQKLQHYGLAALVILFSFVYLMRLFLHDPVVSVNITEGLIYKTIFKISQIVHI